MSYIKPERKKQIGGGGGANKRQGQTEEERNILDLNSALAVALFLSSDFTPS